MGFHVSFRECRLAGLGLHLAAQGAVSWILPEPRSINPWPLDAKPREARAASEKAHEP